MNDNKTESIKTFYTTERKIWREWLTENFQKEDEVWFVFPMKSAGAKGVSYNDAVEEALCFGWIDSTIKNIDSQYRAQRFSPRKKGSGYSRANVERLIWLENHNMLHPSVRDGVLDLIQSPYEFPLDILNSIRENKTAWENFEKFPESYKRIRIAYVDSARKRPAEFEKRLRNFIVKTEQNKLFGYGGIDKYFNNQE